MNYEWIGKTKKKKFDPKKKEKTVKIKVKLPHVNKKSLARKGICFQTPFSHYFKIRVKKFHAAKPLAFSLHFLFRLSQNHYSNVNSKIMKMCEQILSKKHNRENSGNDSKWKSTWTPSNYSSDKTCLHWLLIWKQNNKTKTKNKKIKIC